MANATGNDSFRFSSDDSSVLYLGTRGQTLADLESHIKAGTALATDKAPSVDDSGQHGTITVTSTVAATAGSICLVVIYYANNSGGGVIAFTYSKPASPSAYSGDLTQEFFVNAPAPQFTSAIFTGTSVGDTLNLTGHTEATTLNLLGNSATVTIGTQATPALTFLNAPDAVTLGSGNGTVQFALQPSSGVETVVNFQLGHDILDIDLTGAAASLLTAINGASSAILLSSSADPAHGGVLLGLGINAASLTSSQHMTLSNGHALFT